MAKHPLNPCPNAAESLAFWLAKYLNYKAITLSNARADKQKLEEAMKATKKLTSGDGCPTLPNIRKAAHQIDKAGIGVYTQFFPSYFFVEWLSQNGDFRKIEELDEETVLEFLTVATSSKSDATKVNYKNALTNFFKYISKQNEENYNIDIDLACWQRNAKNAASRMPEYLNDEELERFFAVLKEHDFKGERSRPEVTEYKRALYPLFFKFLFLTGTRISEAIDIRIKDIEIHSDVGAMVVKIRKGKGNKERIVSIPYSCQENTRWCIEDEYKAYMKVRRCNDPALLFCDENGKPLYPRKVDMVMKEILGLAGIRKKKNGVHLLRHSNASYIYRKTNDILLVKERLGHESVRVTERYTHLSEDDMVRSVEVFGGKRNKPN